MSTSTAGHSEPGIAALPPELRLRALRKRHDLTQKELAERAGLDPTTVSDIECGSKNIGNKSRAALATIFDVAAVEELEASAPTCPDGLMRMPDGKHWLATKRLDPHYSKPFRAQWKKDNPGQPWPYPTIIAARLGGYRQKARKNMPEEDRKNVEGLRVEVGSCDAPEVPGKIRGLLLTVTAPCSGGTQERKVWFHHPDDARKAETAFFRPTGLKGVWMGGEVYRLDHGDEQHPPGRYVTEAFLSQYYKDPATDVPVMKPGFWYDATLKRTTYLSPDVNGGKLRFVRSKRDPVVTPRKARSKGRKIRRVVARLCFLDDAESIIDQVKHPKTPPAWLPGEWVKDVEFTHIKLGTCYTDDEMAERCLTTDKSAPRRWFRKGHDVLPKDVNDGKLRRVEVLHIDDQGNRKFVWVSSWEDGKKIREYNQVEKKVTIGEEVPGMLSALDIARKLGKVVTSTSKKTGRSRVGPSRALGIVLGMFAQENPQHVTEIAKHVGFGSDRSLKLLRRPKRYSVTQLEAWLKKTGKTIEELAREKLRKLPTTGRRLLARATAFWQLALTSQAFVDADTRKRKGNNVRAKQSRRHLYHQFLYHPPYDEVLQPIPEGVPAKDIYRWAEEVGIGRAKGNNKLRRVGKVVGAEYVKDASGGRWRLTKPVVLERPKEDAVGTNGALDGAASGGPANGFRTLPKNVGGRPRDNETAEVLEFCYTNFIKNGISRPRVMLLAQAQFGIERAPKRESHVKTYAQRWANSFSPPLSLARSANAK